MVGNTGLTYHSVGELQLFAWRRYVLEGDTDAISVDPFVMFDWVVLRNPHFDFNQYVALSEYDASSVAPSTWRPYCLLNCLRSVYVGSSSHKRLTSSSYADLQITLSAKITLVVSCNNS